MGWVAISNLTVFALVNVGQVRVLPAGGHPDGYVGHLRRCLLERLRPSADELFTLYENLIVFYVGRHADGP
jgi:hypothetical protein